MRQAGLAIVLVAALSDDEVAAHGAIRSTSAARTVVDCARRLPPRDALAMADAALRRGLTDRQALRTVLDRQSGWKGVAQARRVLELADGRRETPFESWSAWAFAVLGVPQPVWQVTITDAAGAFLGRVDGWWPEGVAGEADGDLKYRLAAAERGGATADNLAAVVNDERRRERGLRHAGVLVVRWSPADVLDLGRATVLAATLDEERARADPSRFTGRALAL